MTSSLAKSKPDFFSKIVLFFAVPQYSDRFDYIKAVDEHLI